MKEPMKESRWSGILFKFCRSRPVNFWHYARQSAANLLC